MKKYRAVSAVGILLGAAVCVLIFTAGMPVKGEGGLEPLKATLLKVGKADAIIIQCQNQTMVIDAGEEEDGEEVIEFLKNQGISQVDTLLITHFDQDHVGGADTLVETLPVGEVLLPDYEGNSTEYVDFMTALQEKEITPRRLRESVEFMLGEAEVLVEPPTSYETLVEGAEMDNNFSLITTIVHGENRLLFTGDAEKQRLREWIQGETAVDCDFLKVPHHGVYNTALQELLDQTLPEYGVICSSNKNPGEVQTLELLKERNCSVFQTKDGNVTVISDGGCLEVHQKLER